MLSLGTSSRAVPQQGDHSLTGVSCPGSCCAGGLLGCVVTQGVGCQRWEGNRLCSQSRCCAPRRDPRDPGKGILHGIGVRTSSACCKTPQLLAPGRAQGSERSPDFNIYLIISAPSNASTRTASFVPPW